MAARTGAERYFEKQLCDAEYNAAYKSASATILAIDELVRSLDERRMARGLSKAELARQAGLTAEAVRRLFTMRSPNPTASTLIALASALDLNLVAAPRPTPRSPGRKVQRGTARV